MRRIIVLLAALITAAVVCVTSCVHKPQVQVVPANGNYPDSVAKIFLSRCTNSGCHNQASYQNAAGLLLDTWDHLLQGGINGAEIVAYNTQYSPLLYYINAHDTPADIRIPDPGHLDTPLTLAEYKTIKNWIACGAPDRNGNIPFASNPDTRQKIYLTISRCNLIAVIDAKSKVVMRYIPVGTYPGNEALHDIEVSSDGKYAYTCFIDNNLLMKIDTRSDTVIGAANLTGAVLGSLGAGSWSIINLSPEDTALMVSGYLPNGYIVTINTNTMQINSRLSIDVNTGGTDIFVNPHGITSNATFDTFFATLQYGNVVNKFSFAPIFKYKYVRIDGNPAVTTNNPSTPNPHQIEMSPDYSKYFVTCQNTGEVRVMDAYADTLIKTITVGGYPQEMAISESKGYLFVVCMLDSLNPNPGTYGSVYVIDYNTLDVVKTLYGDFYQPHDAAVDEQDGLLFICSTNQTGPPLHHSSGPCGGNNGWYTVYDLNTFQPDPKRYQVSADPYAISPRF